jgi:hypothetical protein
MDAIQKLQDLAKALEGGGYNAAPSTLTQGSALQVEDLSNVMTNVTFDDEHIKLQNMLKVESCKSTLAQFDRQLSYGMFGGSAQIEGHVGQEETSDVVRVTVPMCYYSHTRRVTDVAKMVATVDGVKADDRAASDAAKKIAGDIEFDCFRGSADFSNAGVFDGHPGAMWMGPNMHGMDLQIRQSDNQRNARDLMFAEYGSDDTVIIAGGGTLSQEMIEDAHVRSMMNFGNADKLVVDPKVLSNYNKIAISMQRIVLAGSAQDASGADLRKQWVSNGTVTLEASRFLSGKSKPAPGRMGSDAVAPASVSCASTTDAAAVTAFASGAVYRYFVTTCNERGESGKTAASALTIATTGDKVVVTITHPGSGTARYFNVYRTLAGGAAGTEKFIGRVVLRVGQTTTLFTDLGNKLPGFVTGFLLESDTGVLRELAPYSRKKLAETELSTVEAHFRFVTLAVLQPRKNCLIDNLK